MRLKKRNIVLLVIIVIALIILAKLIMGNDNAKRLLGSSTEVQGVVLNFNEDGMEIETMTTRILEDGSIVGETGVGNPVKQIFFTDETIFEIQNMVRKENGEVTEEIVSATMHELTEMSSVIAWGKYQGEKYYADKVHILVNVN